MSANDPRPSDIELWAAVEATLRDTILPELTDDWARSAAIQLMGLAAYAQQRGGDRSATNTAELTVALDDLAAVGNSIVTAVWPQPARTPVEAVSLCLAEAVLRTDSDAVAVRERLRSLVSNQLDVDLAETAPLLDYFRGRTPDA